MKIKSIKEKHNDHVIYCDTDSVAGDSFVRTNLYGTIDITTLFNNLKDDTDIQYMSDSSGREFVFPSKLKLPFLCDESEQILEGNVEYVEKHLVKKELFEVETESGKKIRITDDHSLIVRRVGSLLEIKPRDLKSDDYLVIMSDDNYKFEKVKRITSLGVVEEHMYDIGMVDTPHTFFANDILVHNSIFCSALPLIVQKHPNVDITDNKVMPPLILEVTREVQDYVNDYYNIMADQMFNVDVDKHRFNIKQEVVAKTSIWLAKKRYAQFIINNGGVEVDELEIKGLDIVRTSFPIKFREFMKEFLNGVLHKVPEKVLSDKIIEFKNAFDEYSIIEIAKNTSVKFKSKDGKNDYNPEGRHKFTSVTGAPAQVKAALYYNDLLKHLQLEHSVEMIYTGQKIKWVYLQQNEYNIDCIALKADDTDPDEILEFIERYVDRNAMYTNELKSKMKDFYDVLCWDFPEDSYVQFNNFFEELSIAPTGMSGREG